MPEKMRALWRGTIAETKTDILDADGKVVNSIVEHAPVEFLEGVPARSLTDDEYRALPDDVRRNVDASPLYLVRTAADMKTDEKDS